MIASLLLAMMTTTLSSQPMLSPYSSIEHFARAKTFFKRTTWTPFVLSSIRLRHELGKRKTNIAGKIHHLRGKSPLPSDALLPPTLGSSPSSLSSLYTFQNSHIPLFHSSSYLRQPIIITTICTYFRTIQLQHLENLSVVTQDGLR